MIRMRLKKIKVLNCCNLIFLHIAFCLELPCNFKKLHNMKPAQFLLFDMEKKQIRSLEDFLF